MPDSTLCPDRQAHVALQLAAVRGASRVTRTTKKPVLSEQLPRVRLLRETLLAQHRWQCVQLCVPRCMAVHGGYSQSLVHDLRPAHTHLCSVQYLSELATGGAALEPHRDQPEHALLCALCERSRCQQEVALFWSEVVASLSRPRAQRLGKEFTQPQFPMGVGSATNTQIKEYHLEVKARHPYAISLARVRLLAVDMLHVALQSLHDGNNLGVKAWYAISLA